MKKLHSASTPLLILKFISRNSEWKRGEKASYGLSIHESVAQKNIIETWVTR